MSEYRIKGETLTGIADAIRSKTGGTEPIPVPEMAAQIEGITGGGVGSSDDVRYVTFMSHDGTVKLGKKAVAVSDDCADPIARDVFDTPTRESDAQYNYAFAGWSKNPDNVLDDTALDAVTEDRVVYAVYAMTVRKYTISYYDGDTLLKSETIEYGSVPSIENPTKDGSSFIGWEPSLTKVTGDASYYAQWKEKVTFAGGSWADIAAISEAGEASDYFSIGDTRDITIGNQVVTFKIVAFNHDILADGSGKAGMTILATELFTDFSYNYYVMNTSATNVGGWASCAARTRLNGTLLAALPEELQAVIKSVTKNYNSGGSSVVSTCADKLWIPSFGEAGLPGCNYSGQKTDYDTAYEGFDPIVGGKNSALRYWLRNAATNAKEFLCAIVKDYNSASWGEASVYATLAEANYTYYKAYMLIGFCI